MVLCDFIYFICLLILYTDPDTGSLAAMYTPCVVLRATYSFYSLQLIVLLSVNFSVRFFSSSSFFSFPISATTTFVLFFVHCGPLRIIGSDMFSQYCRSAIICCSLDCIFFSKKKWYLLGSLRFILYSSLTLSMVPFDSLLLISPSNVFPHVSILRVAFPIVGLWLELSTFWLYFFVALVLHHIASARRPIFLSIWNTICDPSPMPADSLSMVCMFLEGIFLRFLCPQFVLLPILCEGRPSRMGPYCISSPSTLPALWLFEFSQSGSLDIRGSGCQFNFLDRRLGIENSPLFLFFVACGKGRSTDEWKRWRISCSPPFSPVLWSPIQCIVVVCHSRSFFLGMRRGSMFQIVSICIISVHLFLSSPCYHQPVSLSLVVASVFFVASTEYSTPPLFRPLWLLRFPATLPAIFYCLDGHVRDWLLLPRGTSSTKDLDSVVPVVVCIGRVSTLMIVWRAIVSCTFSFF